MPALTNVDVVRALLWLGLRGVSIPDRVIAFALEEDFADCPSSHPYAVACALLEAADETLVLIGSERRPQQPIYRAAAANAAPWSVPPPTDRTNRNGEDPHPGAPP